MLLAHLGQRPRVEPNAYVPPTATLWGDPLLDRTGYRLGCSSRNERQDPRGVAAVALSSPHPAERVVLPTHGAAERLTMGLALYPSHRPTLGHRAPRFSVLLTPGIH